MNNRKLFTEAVLVFLLRGVTSRRLDLSYLHNIPATKIENYLETALVADDDIITVDISASALGNVGVQAVLDSIMENSKSPIRFVAPMNQMSSDGVSSLFNTILKHGDNTTRIDYIDLSWSQLSDSSDNQVFLNKLRDLFGSSVCPKVLRFDSCGVSAAACRSMGKGLINKHEKVGINEPISLHLCMNNEIGDAGVAALAAAIRSIAMSDNPPPLLFETLSLSSCGITDAGAIALSKALESCHSRLINHLDLSNNNIGEDGASAIGRSLAMPERAGSGPGLSTLDLSGNADIGNRGVTEIAVAMENGRLPCAILRSCGVQASGARCLGESIHRRLISDGEEDKEVVLDLSGNPLGVLKGKPKDKGKYSASRLKSTAAATAASYFGMFKKGLKDVGVDFGSTLESDDEEEKDDEGSNASEARVTQCGIKAFTNAFLSLDGDEGVSVQTSSSQGLRRFELGLRRCFLDYGAADALAAMKISSHEELKVKLSLQLDMNPALEDDVLESLQGTEDDYDTNLLQEMSERYLDAVEAMKDARRRADEAASMPRDFNHWSEEPDHDFDNGLGYSNFDDSDDDYEQEYD